MKFACETCSTKYVIPDERVAGRLLRVRCKRCRAVMEVLGPATEQNRAPTKSEKLVPTKGDDVAHPQRLFAVADPFAAFGSGNWSAPPAKRQVSHGGLVVAERSSGPVEGMPVPPAATAAWHVAIKGQARGPFTDEELHTLASGGKIHARSRVWRAGMDAWVRLEDVCELAWLNPVLRPRSSSRSADSSSSQSFLAPVAPVLDEVSGMSEAPEQDPARPFSGLLAMQQLKADPPPELSDVVSTPGTLSMGGQTGWFSLTPQEVDQLVVEERVQFPVQGPMLTGTHVVRAGMSRVAWTAMAGSVIAFSLAALLFLPWFLRHEAVAGPMVRPPVRVPAALAAPLEPTAGPQELSNIRALAQPKPAAVAVVVPPQRAEPQVRDMTDVREALDRAAAKVVGR
ncbi:MAG: zinc-ribbon domain-containing protein [Deltaproteobacteria bacterium]|nr:zinc-ribbon domain-containing protein [Deltaproteobacteria bacterium]